MQTRTDQPQIQHRPIADWAGAIFLGLFALYFLTHLGGTGLLLVPIICQYVVESFAFLARRRPKAACKSVGARIAAYGTFLLIPVFMAVTKWAAPDLIESHSTSLMRNIGGPIWLVGCIYGVVAVWALRYSFSIEPQARKLETAGPYHIARHPIYASYLLQYGGFLLLHASWALSIALVVWLVLLLTRIHYEEAILRRVFPEYVTYAERVGMFTPRVSSLFSTTQRVRQAQS